MEVLGTIPRTDSHPSTNYFITSANQSHCGANIPLIYDHAFHNYNAIP